MTRALYGKKPARSTPAVSSIFTDSSPSTSKSGKASSKHGRIDPVEAATKQLESLDLGQDISLELPTRRQRKPLSKRDGNSRPSSKHGNENERTKISKSDTVQETHVGDISSGSDEQSQITQHQDVNALSSNVVLRDPYILPLVSLTNDQQSPLPFEFWSEPLIQHFSITKIAEASYSEVYRLSLLGNHPSLGASDESVLKLVAIKPMDAGTNSTKTKAQLKREEGMSSVEDVVSEVRLLKRLTEVPGFTNYRALHVLQGRPSKPFIQAWKEWNKARAKGEKSEFPDPSRKANYDEHQFWAVIEMQDAGTDVEKLLEDERKNNEMDVDETSIQSIWSVWDVFWQTALAVAKGENEAEFEHRDLHLGNICVRRKDRDKSSPRNVWNSGRMLGFSDLETTIIDYTLSRAELALIASPDSRLSHSSSTKHSVPSSLAEDEGSMDVAYNPLQNQPKIFEGDADIEYQYDIYRYMRTLVETHSGQSEPVWRQYRPKTNLLWLHFVLSKLCETLHWPSDRVPRRKDKKQIKALELEEILIQVGELLRVERLLGEEDCFIASATELVATALEQGWLDQADINC